MLKNDKSHQDVLSSMVCYFLFFIATFNKYTAHF